MKNGQKEKILVYVSRISKRKTRIDFRKLKFTFLFARSTMS
jgi:hypothetical protein